MPNCSAKSLRPFNSRNTELKNLMRSPRTSPSLDTVLENAILLGVGGGCDGVAVGGSSSGSCFDVPDPDPGVRRTDL